MNDLEQRYYSNERGKRQGGFAEPESFFTAPPTGGAVQRCVGLFHVKHAKARGAAGRRFPNVSRETKQEPRYIAKVL